MTFSKLSFLSKTPIPFCVALPYWSYCVTWQARVMTRTQKCNEKFRTMISTCRKRTPFCKKIVGVRTFGLLDTSYSQGSLTESFFLQLGNHNFRFCSQIEIFQSFDFKLQEFRTSVPFVLKTEPNSCKLLFKIYRDGVFRNVMAKSSEDVLIVQNIHSSMPKNSGSIRL